ncbi:MAG: M23 family metallopeptidase [Bacillota bacterium]|nr:M23 family metallopeptidase [Bacillota bacterium]
MTAWSNWLRHPLVILTCSVLSAVTVAGLAGPWLPADLGEADSGGAEAALPFSSAPLTPRGDPLPVSPVVRLAPSAASTRPEVAVSAIDPRFTGAARLRVLTHTVAEGETLSSIAARYRSDVDTLEGLNPDLTGDELRPGQKLKVMTGRGALYTLREGETLAVVAKRFWVAEEKIRAANGLASDEPVEPGQQIILPDIKPRRRDDWLASRGLGPLYLTWPTRGWLSSRFGLRWGRMHEGIDIATSWGRQVVASAPGRVEFAGWRSGYGRLVILDHGRGTHTWYAHNSRLLVRPGQQVERGEVIALSGSSGSSTGPHLHFEVRVNGRPQNPLSLLRR